MISISNDQFITGEKVYLRPFKESDLTMISRLENHPDPRATLFYSIPTTLDQQYEKIKKMINDPSNIVLIICTKEKSEAIGETAFVRIDWISRAAVFYIGIADKENWSKGYGSETTQLMINYAFDTLNLNRIQLHVAVENISAVKVYEKCGFKIEGTLRDAMYHEGRYSDFYVMGLLKKEFSK
jgi:RimJ/RimL family protein N-acetyltransferase